MEIVIAGHQAGSLQRLLGARPGEFDALIITDPVTPFPPGVTEMVNDHLWLKFDDVTQGHVSYKPPTRAQVKRALDWVIAKERERIVVACHAGISRSSGLALLIAHQAHGLERAMEVLDPKEHWPNDLVVKLGCDILEAPLLWGKFAAFRQKLMGMYDDDEWEL